MATNNDTTQDRPVEAANEIVALTDTLLCAIDGGVPTGDDAPGAVAKMILERAVTVRDFLSSDVRGAIYGSQPEQFDRHYQLLRGIISTSRALFQEVNEPSGEGGLNPAASEISCALDCLIDQLDTAMTGEADSAPAFNGRQKNERPTPPELIESAEAMLVNTLDALDYDNMDQAEANRVTAAIMAAENAIVRRS